ncbi:sensor histidine kinase [Streptomyces sp. NPDC002577]
MTALSNLLAPRTLRGRLSLVALTTATFLMVMLTVAFNIVARDHLRRQADDELRTRAAAIAATVDTSGPAPRVLETSNDRLMDANVWVYADTRLLEQPPSAVATGVLTHVADDLVRRGGRHCVTTNGYAEAHERGPIRLCSEPVPVSAGTGSATVVTALDLSPYRSSADALLLGSFALDSVMLACTYALTRLAVGRALRPVRAMTDQATHWSAVASDERFGAVDRPAELARLGSSLDALLDRIRAVLQHERQLTGELSHELRTPLSRVVAELDWWQSRPRSVAETRATHQVIADAAESMRTICDTLLNHARDEVSAAPGTTAVLPTLRRIAGQLGAPGHVTVAIGGEAGNPEAGVQEALLERIVSPLLTNALRYARSSVSLRTGREPGGVRGVWIDITDDGPGVPPSFAGQLFQPGRRADPDDGHGGAGLGLPLARRLARSVGGEVSHDPGHTPGARFVITLPAG